MTSWLQDLDTLLEDSKTWTRGWNAAKWWRNANSCLQDLETLLERNRNAAWGRRNANSCSQDRRTLLEDLVVAEWQLPDSTLRTCWNITRDDRARLVWSNRDFFSHTNKFTYSTYFLTFWNSLYVYTRGILGCLLGFWAKTLREQKYETRVQMVYMHGHCEIVARIVALPNASIFFA